MKIYTEVNYIWKDNKLVQTDSKSFDYEGEVESCHWYHRHTPVVVPKITIPSVPDIVDAYKGSDIDKGLTSGQSAITKGLEKIKKDNPNPNLNVQTPDQLLGKGKQMLHDAATNLKRIWDRNRPNTSLPDLSQYIPTTDESTDSPLLENEPGSRATAGGGKYGASGRSTSGRRGIEKKHTKSIINQQLQKRLPA